MEASGQKKRFYQVGNIKSETIITEIRSEKNNRCILADFTYELETWQINGKSILRINYITNRVYYETFNFKTNTSKIQNTILTTQDR